MLRDAEFNSTSLTRIIHGVSALGSFGWDSWDRDSFLC
jgi:hypothetical protein